MFVWVLSLCVFVCAHACVSAWVSLYGWVSLSVCDTVCVTWCHCISVCHHLDVMISRVLDVIVQVSYYGCCHICHCVFVLGIIG